LTEVKNVDIKEEEENNNDIRWNLKESGFFEVAILNNNKWRQFFIR